MSFSFVSHRQAEAVSPAEAVSFAQAVSPAEAVALAEAVSPTKTVTASGLHERFPS